MKTAPLFAFVLVVAMLLLIETVDSCNIDFTIINNYMNEREQMVAYFIPPNSSDKIDALVALHYNAHNTSTKWHYKQNVKDNQCYGKWTFIFELDSHQSDRNVEKKVEQKEMDIPMNGNVTLDHMAVADYDVGDCKAFTLCTNINYNVTNIFKCNVYFFMTNNMDTVLLAHVFKVGFLYTPPGGPNSGGYQINNSENDSYIQPNTDWNFEAGEAPAKDPFWLNPPDTTGASALYFGGKDSDCFGTYIVMIMAATENGVKGDSVRIPVKSTSKVQLQLSQRQKGGICPSGGPGMDKDTKNDPPFCIRDITVMPLRSFRCAIHIKLINRATVPFNISVVGPGTRNSDLLMFNTTNEEKQVDFIEDNAYEDDCHDQYMFWFGMDDIWHWKTAMIEVDGTLTVELLVNSTSNAFDISTSFVEAILRPPR